MTRDNLGQVSGQTRDTRDIHRVPARDTRDKPPRRVVPCPGTDCIRPRIQPLSGLEVFGKESKA
jgi:hypothetical protein